MKKDSRNVLLCVTGGIAAYKIPELVRRLQKANSDCSIEVIMTAAAESFVTPTTLATLTGHCVWRQADFLSNEHGFEIPHIRLGEWASVIAIAPCTANTLAGLACGRASSLVEATVLAARCPVLVFPAMNVHMYENAATQANLNTLKSRAFRVIEPSSGNLACGEDGRGRMPEPSEIAEEIFRALHGSSQESQELSGTHVLVTAGPTREYLDPVRFISNPSTGRMGLAMARAAWYRGADVRVVLGPVGTPPLSLYGFDVININSALEMRDAVMANLQWADVIVKSAAVGDYRAREQASHKVKREGRSEIAIDLVQNPDIAAEVGKNKRLGQVLIGFAAETDDLLKNARGKLERKNLDLILANDVLKAGSGFASDTNTLRMITRDDEMIFSGSKVNIAGEIWDVLAARGMFKH